MARQAGIRLAGLGIVNGIDLDQHAGLLWSISRLVRQRTNGRVSCAELLGPGWEGLRRAAERFDPSRGSFAGFASVRIRGAMLDYLRTQDLALSRFERMKSKARSRPARMLVDWSSLDFAGGPRLDPIAAVEPADARELAREIFRPLPARLRRVAVAHFLEGQSYARIAEWIGCTQSNVMRMVKQVRGLILPRERAFELLEQRPARNAPFAQSAIPASGS